MSHTDVIQTITDALKDAPGIRALFLSGSFGNDLNDDFSDIDFVLVATDGATDDTAQIWRDAIAKTGEIVLWWDRTTVPVLINAITADWMRTDVVVLKPDQLGAQNQAALKPLFDHDAIYKGLPEHAPDAKPSAARFTYQVEEFIRILGLLHLAVGREEYINGVLGVFHLRNKLVDLLIAQTNAPNRGGILHLNRLITTEQKAVLMALPPAIASKDAMIDAHLAYAETFLPRARDYAKKIGATWPEAFEAATWEQLNKTLGIKRPYDPSVS